MKRRTKKNRHLEQAAHPFVQVFDFDVIKARPMGASRKMVMPSGPQSALRADGIGPMGYNVADLSRHANAKHIRVLNAKDVRVAKGSAPQTEKSKGYAIQLNRDTVFLTDGTIAKGRATRRQTRI